MPKQRKKGEDADKKMSALHIKKRIAVQRQCGALFERTGGYNIISGDCEPAEPFRRLQKAALDV